MSSWNWGLYVHTRNANKVNLKEKENHQRVRSSIKPDCPPSEPDQFRLLITISLPQSKFYYGYYTHLTIEITNLPRYIW
jgi:hypothetical protein